MNDPLANFRRKPAEPSAATASEREPYQAFKAVDRRQFRLSIRPTRAPWVRPSYSYLQYIVEDAGAGRRVDLVYGFMVVVVKGRHLQELVGAIDGELCEYIQQFNPAKHGPAEEGRPVIESIDLHVDEQRRAQVLDDPEKRKRPALEDS